MPLSPDDPARAKIIALREKNATADEVMDALETYDVCASYLVKALSPGHAKLVVAELMEHMIEAHLARGTFAVSSVVVAEKPIDWLDGPLFGGDMNG